MCRERECSQVRLARCQEVGRQALGSGWSPRVSCFVCRLSVSERESVVKRLEEEFAAAKAQLEYVTHIKPHLLDTPSPSEGAYMAK